MFAEGFIIYISVVVGSSVLLSSFVLCCPVCPSSHRCHSLAFHRSRTLLLSFYRSNWLCSLSCSRIYIVCVCVCCFLVLVHVVRRCAGRRCRCHFYIALFYLLLFPFYFCRFVGRATSFRYTFRRRLSIINMIVLLIFSASSCQRLIFIANFIVSILSFSPFARERQSSGALLKFIRCRCRLEASMRNCFAAHTK